MVLPTTGPYTNDRLQSVAQGCLCLQQKLTHAKKKTDEKKKLKLKKRPKTCWHPLPMTYVFAVAFFVVVRASDGKVPPLLSCKGIVKAPRPIIVHAIYYDTVVFCDLTRCEFIAYSIYIDNTRFNQSIRDRLLPLSKNKNNPRKRPKTHPIGPLPRSTNNQSYCTLTKNRSSNLVNGNYS